MAGIVAIWISKKYRKSVKIANITTAAMADKDKKRKREQAREERPHKRVALASTIRLSHLPKENIGPVIGELPNLHPLHF